MRHRDGHLINNAIPLCQTCNRSKSDHSYLSFFSREEILLLLQKNVRLTKMLNTSEALASDGTVLKTRPPLLLTQNPPVAEPQFGTPSRENQTDTISIRVASTSSYNKAIGAAVAVFVAVFCIGAYSETGPAPQESHVATKSQRTPAQKKNPKSHKKVTE